MCDRTGFSRTPVSLTSHKTASRNVAVFSRILGTVSASDPIDMFKLISLILAASAVSLSAMANQTSEIPGDADFLADAYQAAQNGSDFSYARQWGPRRAYDGTDTYQYYQSLIDQGAESAAIEAVETSRSDYITRTVTVETPAKGNRLPLRGRLDR